MSQNLEAPDANLFRGRYWNDAITVSADSNAHRLGSKGLFVRSKVVVPVGALLQFELSVADEPPVTGVVRVVDRVSAGEVEGEQPGLQVKFVQIDDLAQAKEVLARLAVATTLSVPPPPPPSASGVTPSSLEAVGDSKTGTTSSRIEAVGKGSRKGKRSDSPSNVKAVKTRNRSGNIEAVSADSAREEMAEEAAPSSHAGVWEAAMELDDEFFDRAPPPSWRPTDDEPTPEAIRAVRAKDPVFQERQQKLRRTFGTILAVAVVIVAAMAVRSMAGGDEVSPPAPRPVEAAKPVETARVEAAKPAQAPPVETAKPAQAIAPVETVNPVEAVAPVGTATPAATAAPAETAKPAAAAPPVAAPKPTPPAPKPAPPPATPAPAPPKPKPAPRPPTPSSDPYE